MCAKCTEKADKFPCWIIHEINFTFDTWIDREVELQQKVLQFLIIIQTTNDEFNTQQIEWKFFDKLKSFSKLTRVNERRLQQTMSWWAETDN